MSVYIPPDITVDRDAIYQTILTQLQTDLPGLIIDEGTFEWALLRSIASLHADQLEVLYERAEGEYDAFGTKILRVAHLDATAATGQVTVTATDTAGHELPAGTGITLAVPGFDRVAFKTAATAVIAPGGSTVTVDIVAAVPGIDGNNLSVDPQLDVSLSWIASLAVVASTSGGTEGETPDEYLDRLSTRLRLLGDTLTTPLRFALAAELIAGVGAALDIDLYKPGPPYDGTAADTDAPGHITVAVRNAAGQPVSSGLRNQVKAFLTANAISPLTVWVIDPTYTALTVHFVAVARAGADPTIVEASAISAVADFLSPANWGRPSTVDGFARGTRHWESQPVVRFQHVSAVLDGVPDLDHWTTLTLNGGTSDITLTGPAGLPNPTVTGDVT